MLSAVKYRIYPTKAQKELIHKHFGCARVVYNHFLDYRQKQFAKGIKETYFTMQKELTLLKKQDEYKYLNECASQSLQMALRQLVTALDNFFAKRAKYPNFKSKKNARQSYAIPQNIKLDNKKVYASKFTEGIKTKIHRKLDKDCIIKQAFISKIADEYYIAISYENNKSLPKPKVIENAVGLDMGLENLIIRSDCVIYKNHKFLQDKENKLIKLQKQLSKKQKGSNNYAKTKLKVAKAHQKITRARDDYLHKISDEITNLYDFIAVENLNIKGLIKNKHLSKSIANASWGKFINLLTYKAENKGKTLMQIDKFFPSSQICSNCGSNTGKKPLHIRSFTCPNCNTKHHRDLNASINIRNYALGIIDDRYKIKLDKSRVGITQSYACKDSSSGVSKYGYILDTSYLSLKQEAHLL
ncbi:ISHa1675 transposase B [Campylobacter jejuni subsp. doylei 269.97]|uniref:ISHa1675 transposase B n=2 Tax=Campylobacter jejuni subsp. doylei TaxID=32021 RepID=A7H1V1_CAMJD|nr:ISHa1675 transposase B [Campylobacter jejuni subsp. doylei 269.97]AVL46756.1 transposase [Campylobacter jejuni subsp. doylei]ABS43400.1 ISHa1675 transposase B [Campylobacter jejuni subsp. doylei 269.97]ABS43889.1 ISHa1675 transposase B [Campylobacter jejuni subsp. doylei 269.97]AVL47543.1 transposase [Campylobacter jejuni subsp. doylei]